jgi:hypothetical protein
MPRLIVTDGEGEYFLNVFYQLEMCGFLEIEDEVLTLNKIKCSVMKAIARDETGQREIQILQKLAWMRHYTESSSLRLAPGAAEGSRCIVLAP